MDQPQIDPTLSLQLKPPQSPQDALIQQNQARMQQAQLNAAAQESQIRNQQIQDAQLETQQRQQDLQDTAATRQFVQKHNGDWEAMLGDPDFQSAVQPKTLLGIQQTVLANKDKAADVQQKNAIAAKAQTEAAAANNELIGYSALGVKKSGYTPQAFDAALLHMEQVDPKNAQQTEQLRQIAAQDPSKIQPIIDQIIEQSPVGQKEADRALKQQTEDREQQTAQADVATKNAALPGVQAESTMKQRQADAQKNLTPQTLSAWVDSAIPPTGQTAALNQRTKSLTFGAVKAGAQMSAVTDIVNKAADSITQSDTAVRTKQMEAGVQLSIAAQNRAAQQGFQSYTQTKADLDKIGAPVEQTAVKIANIRELMDKNTPQAWTNIPAMVLSLSAGGQGSGLRMNQALIDQELGGAGKLAELQGKFQQWNPNLANASKIPGVQKQEFKGVVDALDKQVQSRLAIVNGARSDLLDAGNDTQAHRKIAVNTHQKLAQLDATAGRGSGSAPTIATKADFDKLPSGTVYMNAKDGKQYRKP